MCKEKSKISTKVNDIFVVSDKKYYSIFFMVFISMLTVQTTDNQEI